MTEALSFDLQQLPRRIVLSRKGSDATWGGRPSLRVGTELISLPIPESAARAEAAEIAGTGTRYGDLPRHPVVGALHTHLRGIGAERHVHLDPDLRPEIRPSPQPHSGEPEGIFGQVGAAERHLRLQEVGPGDLFLFFGWFRETALAGEGWRYTGADEHCLWGWLQIESSHGVTTREAARELGWAAHHPHVAHWERYDRHNRVYRARKRLSFAPHLPGSGVFRWNPSLTLTRQCGPPGTRSEWCLPGFFRRTGLTYNQVDGPACRSRRGQVHLTSAPIGQEFVFPAHRPFRRREHTAVAAWLRLLFSGSEGV